MRARLCLIGAGLLLLAGCGEDPAAVPPAPAAPSPVLMDRPASAAGGACEFLDYSTIEEIIGVRFTVAAASEVRDTRTCVLRSEGADYPDLTLSMTETSATATIFKSDVVPDGGKSVSGLGKAAYQMTAGPSKGAGPSVEIGWLSAKGQLAVLRYGFAAGQSRDDATALVTKVVALAKKVDGAAA